MAFRVVAKYPEIEYRGFQSGHSEKTKRDWLSLIFEDEECNQLNVSVPLTMQQDVREMTMRRGDHYAISIVAVATADGNSYVQLRALPELVDPDDDTEVDF